MASEKTLVRIRFEPSGRESLVPTGTTLYAAAKNLGLPIASACDADGICARCGMEILCHEDRLSPEDEPERSGKHANRVDAKLRLSCLAVLERGGGDPEALVVTTTYW